MPYIYATCTTGLIDDMDAVAKEMERTRKTSYIAFKCTRDCRFKPNQGHQIGNDTLFAKIVGTTRAASNGLPYSDATSLGNTTSTETY